MPWPLPRKKKSWANEHGPCAQEDNGGRAFRPPPCRHHHGWQRPLGEAAFPAAHHGSSQGCGGGAPRSGGRARPQIGRASGRERVRQYVSISVVAVYFKKNTKKNRSIRTTPNNHTNTSQKKSQ